MLVFLVVFPGTRAHPHILRQAGLFSAVLTAFNVQSYQLLQPQPTDPTLAVLERISAQLTSFSVNPSFLNSTQPALSEDEVNPPFRAPASAVWINTLWFSSLVCSLASASIALMVKQWLHELSVGVSGTSRESARIRQYRVNSLRRWRVGGIVIVIPILLQIALVLFLTGLVILLWTLHGTVAAVASALVGTLFVFLAVTTLLPVLRVDCCYRSPQAIGIFIALRGVRRAIRQFLFSIVENAWNLTKQWRRTGGLIGSLADFSWRMYAVVCVAKKELPAWYGREQLEVAKTTPALEGDLVAMAYTTTFDAGCLDKTRLLLVDLPWKQAMACYDKIFAARARVWGEQVSRVQDKFPQHTYDMLRVMLTVGRTERDQCWEDGVMTLLGRLPPQRDDVFDNDGLKLMCILAMDNNAPADLAFLQIVMHLRKQGVLQTESTSSGIRTGACIPSSLRKHDLTSCPHIVMVMAEWRTRNPGGSDPSTTLRHYLQSVELIIHCALRQTTPGLSAEERAAVRTRTRSAFASFRDFLRTSLWREPSLYICLGLSNMVPLLVELVQQDRELVTDELVEVLSSVWSAVQEDELGMAGGDRLRRLHAYVEWTGEVLEALKAVVSGKPVNPSTSHALCPATIRQICMSDNNLLHVGRKVVFERPDVQQGRQRTRMFSSHSISSSRSFTKLRLF